MSFEIACLFVCVVGCVHDRGNIKDTFWGGGCTGSVLLLSGFSTVSSRVYPQVWCAGFYVVASLVAGAQALGPWVSVVVALTLEHKDQ